MGDDAVVVVVVEQQVPGPGPGQRGPGGEGVHLPGGPDAAALQADPGVAVGGDDQAGAVEAVGAGAAVAVGLTLGGLDICVPVDREPDPGAVLCSSLCSASG